MPDEKDLSNIESKKLAAIIHDASPQHTLANLLEWQEQNLSFWWERWPFDLSMKILIPLTLFMILSISLPIFILLNEINPFLLFISIGVLLFLSLLFFLSTTFIKLIYIFISLPIIYLFIIIIFQIPEIAIAIVPFILFYAGCIGAFIIIGLYLLIRYRVLTRGEPLIKQMKKFIIMLNDTFRLKLSIKKILKYHLAICKDYTLFNTVMLTHLFPKNEIYIFSILSHAAPALKIKNEYYILDQGLPLYTKDTWLKKWNKNKAKVHEIQMDRRKKTFQIIETKIVTISPPSKKMNITELTREIKKTLNIKKETTSDFNIVIPFRNFDDYNISNEIVKHSIERKIIKLLLKTINGNIKKIINIELIEKDRDLLIKVYFETMK